MVQFKCGSLSITGGFRENNEDAYIVHPKSRYFIVADGMGGQAAGEKASELATELIPQKLDQLMDFKNDDPPTTMQSIDEAVAFANSEIIALSEIDPRFHNMGTTIAFIVCVAGKLYIGGVGDSRVYRLRGDNFEQLTIDHSMTQALVEHGTITEEDAVTHRYRNVLYRYLGAKDGGTGIETKQVVPEAGDCFLMCSDGVMDGIDDESLVEFLKQNDDPQAAAEAIVSAAMAGGSKDNITCVVVHVE